MSKESAEAFVARATTDAAFAEELVGAASAEERRQLAVAEGYDFTAEELQAVEGRRRAVGEADFPEREGGDAPRRRGH